MKPQAIILFSLIIMFSPALIQAEDEFSIEDITYGLGVSLDQGLVAYSSYAYSTIVYPGTQASIYFPIFISNRFRIEPEFGVLGLERNSRSNYNFRFGLGLFPFSLRKSVIIYGGLRFGFILSTSQDEKKWDIFAGPSFGGEYFFSKHFSLGAETQLNYVSLGEWEGQGDREDFAILSKSCLFLRWYF